jgi:hypothetical protein
VNNGVRPALIGAVLLCAVLAACGDGDDAAGVLHKDDLPSFSKVTTGKNLPAVAVCGEIKDAEFSLTIGNRPEGVTREYTLDNGDYLGSSALGTPRRYGSAAAALDRVADAIESCAAQEPVGDETFTPLTGLDSGAVGYTSTSTTSNGPRVGERVFAVQGDRIVVVGTRHDGDGDPTVDIAKLLPKALDRAKDAPKD